LKDFIINKKPIEVWIQENNHFATFYDFENNKVIKIILHFFEEKIYIVTFYLLNKEQRKELKK
jgi:hypothetical protein